MNLDQTRTDATQNQARRLRRVFLSLAMSFLWTGLYFLPAAAAEFVASESTYVLPQGQVIADDLYVVAPEIVINGTVEGDLLAAASYIEINGAVNGSFMGAAAGIQINGVVQNSVRVAAMSVVLDGAVRKDFIAAAGTSGPGALDFPIPIGNRTHIPGIQLTRNSSIAGDASLAAGSSHVAGVIGGDLSAAVNRLDLAGRTEGAAVVRAATLQIQDSARIGGPLSYMTRESPTIPEGVAASITAIPWDTPADSRPAPTPVNPVWQLFAWLWRLAVQLIGLSLIAWLLYTFAPGWVRKPAAAIEAQPVEAGLYGVVGVAVIAPLALALTFLGSLFWGLVPGGLTFSAASFGLMSIAWLLSPIVTGLWVGRRIVNATNAGRPPRAELQTLLIGVVAIVALANIVGVVPCLGLMAEPIVYLLSLALALGGIILARLRPATADDAADDTTGAAAEIVTA